MEEGSAARADREQASAPTGGRPASRGRSAPVLELWLPTALILVGAASLLPSMRDHLSTDGVSYLSIAGHLLAGDLDGAVNPYWSPLLSWLVAPLLAVGLSGPVALKVVSAIGAGAVWAQVRGAARDLGAGSGAVLGLGVALAPLLVWAAMSIPPDLLVAAPVIWFVRRLARPDAAPRAALATGAIGGVAGLAKLYAAPVVAVVLGLTVAARLVAGGTAGRPSATGGRAGRGLVARHRWVLVGFAAVLLPWAVLISLDQGRPTLGTAATTNVALVAEGSPGHPVLHGGLRAPPHPGATSAWEDPSAAAPTDRGPAEALFGASGATDPGRAGQTVGAPGQAGTGPRSPPPSGGRRPSGGLVGARAMLTDLAGNVGAGLTRVVRFGARWWPLTIAVAAGWLVLGRRRVGSFGVGMALVTAAAVWTAGLTPVVVQPRYLWAPLLLVAPLAALALDRRTRAGRLSAATALTVAMLVVAVPLIALRPGTGRAQADAADDLRPLGLDGARVASVGAWHDLVMLCWRLDCAYHGTVRPFADAGEIARELDAHGVDVLVDAVELRRLPMGLDRVAHITLEDGPATVYRVRGSARGGG